MDSEVDICNAALDELGADAITSLTDASETAILCNRNFIPQRDFLLRSHTWNFARARQELALSAITPSFGWLYAFALPSDFKRFICFNEDPEMTIKYDIEGDYLLTNNTNAKILYIKEVTDITKFDDLFTQALVYRLAMTLAYPLTGNQTLKQSLFSLYNDTLFTAKAVNAQDRYDIMLTRSDYLNARI